MSIFDRINDAKCRAIVKTGDTPNAVLLGEIEWGEFDRAASQFCTIADPKLKGKRSSICNLDVYMVDAESFLAVATVHK